MYILDGLYISLNTHCLELPYLACNRLVRTIAFDKAAVMVLKNVFWLPPLSSQSCHHHSEECVQTSRTLNV